MDQRHRYTRTDPKPAAEVDSGAPEPTEDPFAKVEGFLGPRAAPRYRRSFRRIGRQPGFVPTFNVAAAVLGPFWWTARQLWGLAMVFWVVEIYVLSHLATGALGNLGTAEAERAEGLLARSEERAAQAERAAAAGEAGAEQMARSAENLAKVAAEAAEEAARLASEAPRLVLLSLLALLAIKGMQLVTANWALERKYTLWRARRASDAIIRVPTVVAAGTLIALTYAMTILSRSPVGAPQWAVEFPTDENWRNAASSAVDRLFEWITSQAGAFFDAITFAIGWVVLLFENFLTGTPWPVVVIIVVVLAWRTAGSRVAIFTAGALGYLGLLGFWEKALETVALLGTAALTAIVLGIPIGVWCARSERVYAIVRPILDFMQTMPAFVYLIPVIALFGIGRPPAVIATLMFGMPPVIRLTALGLKSVPEDVREAAMAFGATKRTILFKVDLPMAMPSILTGINQTILMSLGMVVIASLIGAKGLGQDVLQALQFAATGYGILSGLAILFCAMVLDRIVQGRSKKDEV